ncbi:hypothetical protein A5834_001808, partial [Enterococcus faecium]
STLFDSRFKTLQQNHNSNFYVIYYNIKSIYDIIGYGKNIF